MGYTSPNLQVARFEQIVLVTRGRDQIALSYHEASELAYHLADVVGISVSTTPSVPPPTLAVREYLGGKERAQGTIAIQRHLKRGGFAEGRAAASVERLLAESVEAGWIRQTGSGRYALP